MAQAFPASTATSPLSLSVCVERGNLMNGGGTCFELQLKRAGRLKIQPGGEPSSPLSSRWLYPPQLSTRIPSSAMLHRTVALAGSQSRARTSAPSVWPRLSLLAEISHSPERKHG